MEVKTHPSVLYLSDKRSLYLGQLGVALSQCHAAGALLLALEGTLSLTDSVTCQEYQSRSFLIPVGCRIQIHAQGTPIAVAFLEPLGRDMICLSKKMSQKVMSDGKVVFYRGILDEDEVIATAQKLVQDNAGAKQALAALSDWIGPKNDLNFEPDSRVVEAIRLIKATYTENLPVEDIARKVELSTPRLIQLFKQVTGIPIRRYRMWYRIYMTAVKAAAGMPLTEASIAAGFSDYSQFSRTFKEIGGVSPSDVLSARDNVSIRVHHAQSILSPRASDQRLPAHSCDCA